MRSPVTVSSLRARQLRSSLVAEVSYETRISRHRHHSHAVMVDNYRHMDMLIGIRAHETACTEPSWITTKLCIQAQV